MRTNILNQEQSMELQNKFIVTFKKRKPEKFNDFVRKLKMFVSKKIDCDILYKELKGSFNKNTLKMMKSSYYCLILT